MRSLSDVESNIMQKISFYCKYERLGASSRIRTLQFLSKLTKIYKIQVNSLLSDKYITNLYARLPQSKLSILLSYCKRVAQLVTDRSDVLIIEKELFPYFPYWFEKIFLSKKKYIVDIDDAVFHNYDLNVSSLKKFLLGNKFKNLFKNSFAVLAGSPYLQEVAELSGARNVIYFPTVIDGERYFKATVHSPKTLDRVVIGWIGSGSTDKYLELIKSSLALAAKRTPCQIVFKIIGSTKALQIEGVEIIHTPWLEDSEVSDIETIDIGIMPLENTLWERGKCAYKLIQYMACGKPVLASAVGANNVVIDHGINGFLCSTEQEWSDAFVTLVNNSELRNQFGNNGMNKVAQHYTVDVNIKILQNLLSNV